MIAQDVIERTLGRALTTGAEFAEVYAEDKRNTSVALDDGKIEQVTSGRDRGAGIRVINGETTGFAHTSDLTERGLAAAAEAAAAAASRGDGGTRTVALEAAATRRVNAVAEFPEVIPKATKVELLQRVDDAARSAGPAIVQVSAGYADSRKRVLVANTDGVHVEDDVVRILARISAVADGDTGMQTGFQSMGHTVGWEVFDPSFEGYVDLDELARDAARQAIVKLNARPAPSGEMPVVIKNGTGGVLFHEACGHGLEADHIQKGASVYAGKVGELVASPLVTLVDDGTMAGEWGTLAYDDEGHATRRNVLIEDGVLTDYMWDYLRSRKDGRAPSGNGRRQSYMHLPMVRMTNTFVLDGADDPDEIVASTPQGVYVSHLGGGSVNTATGDFVFGMREAYLIEDGQITEPLREGNLIGNGPQVLRDIDLLGNDFAMGNPGTCGKDGQGVPVGDGQPTLRVKSLTIGGTAA
ncbi:MAG: TldD/PmbA family protein [Ilumatobacter sp.]|uniref:TldD/PmbA family protein n=1 Tax=Ilumatobacter sp. TaxID=1967498 RepID=UPI002614CD49|nr:TldD/PmbA family protein [Ilumatobacter sp.]MDJ0767687.1 TldD/PmbA family protein [Ilumatobacter sp.]